MDFLRVLEGIRTPLFDNIFQIITYFGQELIIIAVICTLYWCVDKRFAYLLGFTYFSAGLCIQTLKITFRIPRPWILDPDFHPVKSAVSGATGYSFPSGHTQSGTSLFGTIAMNTKKRLIAGLCVCAFLLIGFSRMYLGVHTPKDVIVSMAVSLTIAWLITRFSSFLLDEKRHVKPIAIVLSVIAAAVMAYAFALYNAGTIEMKYAADCFKAAGAGLGFALGFYIERSYLNFEVKTNGIKTQIFKVVIGLILALLLKSLFSTLLGSSLPTKAFEYFIVVLWILVVYPYCFTRILKSSLQ